MASRILDARDAVVALLTVDLALAEPDRIKAAYVPLLERDEWTGERYWVYPTALADADRLSRRAVRKEVKVTVEREAKYDAAAQADEEGRVPVEWADAQVCTLEADVFEPLNAAGARLASLIGGRFRNERCEITLVYDPGRLHQDKVFASLIELTLSEQAGG